MPITLDSNVSAGPVIATDSETSTNYPLSKILWGASGAFTRVTDDTAGAMPVKAVTDTGRPLVIRGLGDSTIPVSGTVAVSSVVIDSGDVIRVVNDTAQAIPVRGVTDTHVAITGDSAAPVFVRGLGDSTVPVSGTVNIVADSGDLIRIANDTAQAVPVRGATDSQVDVRTDSGDTIRLVNDTAQAVPVRGATDSTVAVSGTVAVSSITIDSGDLIRVANDTAQSVPVRLVGVENSTSEAANSSGLSVFSNDGVSSAVVTVSDSASRLYGYYIFNADTGVAQYLNIFTDDSAGVTLGTTVPLIHIGLPPLGAANLFIPGGIPMSSGIGVSAVSDANDTGLTGAGANEMHVVIFYREA